MEKTNTSVIVTVKNDAKALRSLLISLTQQSLLPHEIVIAVAHSNQETWDELHLWQENSPVPIQILDVGNATRSAGRNAAVAAAHGNLLLFTDAGCVPGKKWVETFSHFFAQNPDAQLASGFTWNTSESAWEKAQTYFVLVPQKNIPKNPLPATRNMALRKESWQKIGKFRPELNYAEDYEWSRRAAKKGVVAEFLPQAKVSWKPRASLHQFFLMIFLLTKGDMQAKTWRWGHLTIWLRWIFFLMLGLLTIFYTGSILFGLVVPFLAWSCLVAMKLLAIPEKKTAAFVFWYGVQQFFAELAVLLGSSAFIFHFSQKSPLLRGISSLGFMRLSTKVFALGRLILLARFLSPTDLGLAGLALMIVAISEVFTETGVNTVLLKNPERFQKYLDTAWTVSWIRGLVISAGMVLLSTSIAQFYSDPQLKTFLLLAASIPFLRGFINPAVVIFQQNLQFEREALFRVGLQILDILAGLLACWWLQSGIGIVVGVLAAVVAEVIASFTLFSQKPKPFIFSWPLVKDLYKESRVIVGNGMLHYLTEHLDDFLIGKILGPTGLGLYQTAYKLASTVTMDLASLVGQTTYPIYAKSVAEKKDIRKQVQKINLFAFVGFLLIGMGVFLLSPLLIPILFTAEWQSLQVLVPLLFVAGACKSFISLWNPVSILAENLEHHVALNSIMIGIIVLGIALFTPHWGLLGASFAVLLAFMSVVPYGWIVLQRALKILDKKSQA